MLTKNHLIAMETMLAIAPQEELILYLEALNKAGSDINDDYADSKRMIADLRQQIDDRQSQLNQETEYDLV